MIDIDPQPNWWITSNLGKSPRRATCQPQWVISSLALRLGALWRNNVGKNAVWEEDAEPKWFVCCSDVWLWGWLVAVWLVGWLVIFFVGLPIWWFNGLTAKLVHWRIQDGRRTKISWVPLDALGSNILHSARPVSGHDHLWIHEPFPPVCM